MLAVCVCVCVCVWVGGCGYVGVGITLCGWVAGSSYNVRACVTLREFTFICTAVPGPNSSLIAW